MANNEAGEEPEGAGHSDELLYGGDFNWLQMASSE